MGKGGRGSEGDLLHLARGGDGDAFETLFLRHEALLADRVRRLLPPAVRRRHSVQDVLQETRIVALDRCASFEDRGAGAFGAWLLGIAENKVREAVRHHRGTARRAVGREVTRGDRTGSRDGPRHFRTPSQDAMAGETADRVRRALATLPEDYREVLRLTRFEGLTLAEAAERMGRSREAVKKLNGRALARLARVLTEDGGSRS